MSRKEEPVSPCRYRLLKLKNSCISESNRLIDIQLEHETRFVLATCTLARYRSYLKRFHKIGIPAITHQSSIGGLGGMGPC